MLKSDAELLAHLEKMPHLKELWFPDGIRAFSAAEVAQSVTDDGSYYAPIWLRRDDVERILNQERRDP